MPRWVAEATSPTMAVTSGMLRNWLMRRRASAARSARRSGRPMRMNATTPDGASVVNRTSVISPSAVPIPDSMSPS